MWGVNKATVAVILLASLCVAGCSVDIASARLGPLCTMQSDMSMKCV